MKIVMIQTFFILYVPFITFTSFITYALFLIFYIRMVDPFLSRPYSLWLPFLLVNPARTLCFKIIELRNRSTIIFYFTFWYQNISQTLNKSSSSIVLGRFPLRRILFEFEWFCSQIETKIRKTKTKKSIKIETESSSSSTSRSIVRATPLRRAIRSRVNSVSDVDEQQLATGIDFTNILQAAFFNDSVLHSFSRITIWLFFC